MQQEQAQQPQSAGESTASAQVANAGSSSVASKKPFSQTKLFAAAIVFSLIVFGALVGFFVLKPGSALTTPAGNVVAVQGEQAEESVVALVGTQNVFKSDLDKRYATVPDGMLTKKQVLDNMVENALVLQEAQEKGISASEQEVQAVISERKNEVDQLLSQGVIDEAFLTQAVTEFIIVNKYLEGFVFNSLSVSDGEALDFFNSNKDSVVQVRASHILVATREEADDLLGQINNGANFEELAKQKSTDTGSAQNGGDLGFFSKTDVVPEFGDTAFLMQVGEPAKVVQTQFGFHIIKVTDKKESFEDFKDQVKAFLISQKKDPAYRAFIEEQKKAKNVQIFEEKLS